MKRYGRLDENLQGTLQKNRVFCAVMPIHDQRISRRTETRRLFELTKLKKAPSFVIVGLFSADHYLVPCLSLLSSECVVFTDVPRDFQRLAEYFSDGWRREGVIDSSCLFKIGAEVRTVRWKISNNTQNPRTRRLYQHKRNAGLRLFLGRYVSAATGSRRAFVYTGRYRGFPYL